MIKHSIIILSISLLTLTGGPVLAQSQIVSDFNPVCDSIETLMNQRVRVTANLKLDKVMKRRSLLDFYFDQGLSDYPWRKEDVEWFKNSLHKLFPAEYSDFRVGEIFCDRTLLDDLVMPSPGNNGKSESFRYEIDDHSRKEIPMVDNLSDQQFEKGLSGRYIALWQSHGRYYETKTQRWEWQRAPMFETIEDMYTQSYVLPFLMPMLENAGAYVMTPRERDTQVNEVITDNDPSFTESRTGLIRKKGEYKEDGAWTDAGTGFADSKLYYTLSDNPFTMGTARQADVMTDKRKKTVDLASATWTPDIPQRGSYAVYISYKSLPNSTKSAHYTVHHMGGETYFIVNQTIGGGIWIYLGTFEFDKGTDGYVTLDNTTPQGRKYDNGTVVTADGVKIGGGMGKVLRGQSDAPVSTYTVSGYPSYAEGALYSMQFSGTDSTIINKWDNDYTNDYADRGAWVTLLSGGSRVNPKAEGKGIPFDLSLAFHTDAGTFPNDSIVGTLSIYTLLCDGKQELPDGEDRMTSRAYADMVQTQVVNDVRAQWAPEWTRRMLWNRSYSESRTTSVPALLLEFLSHQNFADMKYGLDPMFRFTVSRAVYKGILKYLSNRYDCPYVVEPLPVHSFAVNFIDGVPDEALLSWLPTDDTLETTAESKGYILYSRIDDDAFDEGHVIEEIDKDGERITTRVSIRPGHVYSFKIVAFNDGGKSFPSEVLSIGTPEGTKSTSAIASKNTVVVVNDFTRVSGPAWFDTPTYAGFDARLDNGVPYIQEINYIGDMYQFRRTQPWMDDDCPGFGASFTDMAGKRIPGNTFDFASIHGKALIDEGYAFYTLSEDAFSSYESLSKGAFAADIICGKQVTVKVGSGMEKGRFQVFPAAFQSALKGFTTRGGNVLISGANIGTDVWDKVYPVSVDSAYRVNTKKFVENVLGYRWRTNYASKTAVAVPFKNPVLDVTSIKGPVTFHNTVNDSIYCVETPDGLVPASENGASFLRYSDTDISAGVCFKGKGYRVVSLGFPIEVITDSSARQSVIAASMAFFKK